MPALQLPPDAPADPNREQASVKVLDQNAGVPATLSLAVRRGTGNTSQMGDAEDRTRSNPAHCTGFALRPGLSGGNCVECYSRGFSL